MKNMEKSKYSFLNNHFKFIQFELDKSNEYYTPFIKYCKENKFYEDCIKEYKYGTCLFEIETKEPFFTELTNDEADYSSFEFYLNQLPDLELDNVAYLFSLVSDGATKQLQDAFSIPTNYPSEFAKAYLKDTYGQVVYTYQFMSLLSCSLIGDDNQYNYINDYRRLFNCRAKKVFDKLEELYLPDGYSLYKLLESYTPYNNNEYSGGFGFVKTPTHKIAWDFIERAKKYITL